MKTWEKILIGLALVGIVFASGIVAYIFTGNGPGFIQIVDHEKIAIQLVSYNATQNSVSIYVQAVNDLGNKATFNGIVFRNERNIETVIPISDTMNRLKITTLTVNLNSTLPSGTYVAILTTAKGSSFVSPSFNVS